MSLNSVNTNAGALIALESLNATNAQLNTTQNRISTGLKVRQRDGQRRHLGRGSKRAFHHRRPGFGRRIR